MNNEQRSDITLMAFVLGIILGAIYLEVASAHSILSLIKVVFISALSMVALPACAFMTSTSFMKKVSDQNTKAKTDD